jgi:hypothetical protein
MEDIGFGLIGMAWNGGSRFWPHINGLRKNFPPLVKLGEAKINFQKGHNEKEEEVKKKKKKKKKKIKKIRGLS